MTRVHKTFVSYHHANDQSYKNRLEVICENKIVSRSVQLGDIDDNTSTENIRRIIREDYLRDSTVTVVLIGKETWQRKHVDWEIAASLRHTDFSSRSGLVGIFLPSHPCYGKGSYNRYTIPPRLWDNIDCGFAKVYDWKDNGKLIQSWIHEAFENRNKVFPSNSRYLFRNNRSGEQWQD